MGEGGGGPVPNRSTQCDGGGAVSGKRRGDGRVFCARELPLDPPARDSRSKSIQYMAGGVQLGGTNFAVPASSGV